jgi:CDP-diacylglycerol--glycerol-3-phosphate 3-phosphatidyltransferase
MLTDVLDGYFARKLKQVTDFGKFYDAVVDKIVIYAVLFSLYSSGAFKYYVIFPMFIRDMIVDSLRSFASRNRAIVGSNKYGKLKFLFQSISVILAILYLDLYQQGHLVFFVLTNSCLAVAFLVSLAGSREVFFEVTSWNRKPR